MPADGAQSVIEPVRDGKATEHAMAAGRHHRTLRRLGKAVGRRLKSALVRERNGFRIRRTSFKFHGFTADDLKRFRASMSRIRFSWRRLRVRICPDALITPLRPRADGKFLGGLFDRDGAAVTEAQVCRDGEGTVVGFESTADVSEPLLFEEAIYGGPLFSGFGHIILESACRLWAAERYPDLPIIVQSQPGNESCETTFLALAALLGVPADRIVFSTEPIRVGRAIVPEPGLTLGREIRRGYLRFVRRRPVSSEDQSDPEQVFLSRAGLNWRQRRAIGEARLEKTVKNAGMKVIRPESLALSDQVAIHERASTLAGFIGSQFHTLFLRTSTKPIDVLYLCSANPNINFFQIDLLFPGRRIYGNVSLYQPFFEFGNRSPFYFSSERIEQLFRELGVNVANVTEPDTATFAFEWSVAYFYFKVYRQGFLSGDFTKATNFRLKMLRKRCTRGLSEDEREQVLRAFRECARRCRVPDHPEVLTGTEQVARTLGELVDAPMAAH